MLARRQCSFVMPDGRACRAGPQRDRPFCFAHDPERVEDATEARRMGGLRRRREGTIAVAYDLPGLDTVDGIRRLLDIVVTDGLGLDNGIARLRVLIATATAATRLLEVGELEARLAALEAALRGAQDRADGLEGGLLGSSAP
jgi:hypothetical protein